MAKPNNNEERTAPNRTNSLVPIRGPTDLNQFIESIFKGFDESLSQLFPSFQPFGGFASSVELVDHGDHYRLTAELPGFSKDEVDVRVNEQALELSAERKAQKESKDKLYTSRERSHSVFHHIVSIPESVMTSKVSGTMTNGVLELKLPKRELVSEGRTRRVPLA